MHDQLKKSEKENYDFKKSVGSKDTALEKLRKENDELWAIVNTDKYKSVRTIETEKEKALEQKKSIEEKFSLLQAEFEILKKDQVRINEKDSEIIYESERLRERDAARELIMKTMEEKIKNLEAYSAKSEQLLAQYKQESDTFRPENE